jgi:hypothetical protein
VGESWLEITIPTAKHMFVGKGNPIVAREVIGNRARRCGRTRVQLPLAVKAILTYALDAL